MNEETVLDTGFVFKEEAKLTVRKTSVFFPGDGFTAYDCQGRLLFRVDSYGPDGRDKDEMVLMDCNGRCLLTVRKKKPSLHQRWEGFLGERLPGKKPSFSVRRSSIIGLGRSNVVVEMYGKVGEEHQYQIEGSFGQRRCRFLNSTKETVAEIRRKVDSSTNVLLGKDVFCLCLKPGFDGAFAMGLVLVLDQIDGDDDYGDEGADQVHPLTE